MKKHFVFWLLICSLLLATDYKAQSAEVKSPDAMPITTPIPWLWPREVRLMFDAEDPRTSLSALISLLTEPSVKVRILAVRVFGERGPENMELYLEVPLKGETPAAAAEMKAAAARVPDGQAQLEAAIAVARVRLATRQKPAEEQVRALQPLLDSKDELVQVEALNALNKITGQAANDALFEFLRKHDTTDEEIESNFAYLRALVSFAAREDPRIVPFIERYYRAKRSEPITGPIGLGRDAVTDNDINQLEPLYWRLRLRHASLKEKEAAFIEKEITRRGKVPYGGLDEILVDAGPPVISFLSKILQDKSNTRLVRESAGVILVQIHHPDVIPVLLGIANDATEDSELRRLMFSGLLRRGEHTTVEATLAELKQKADQKIGPNPNIDEVSKLFSTLYSVSGMAKIGVDKQALEAAIAPYLQAAEWFHGSDIAAKVVRDVGSKDSIDLLISLFKNAKGPSSMQVHMMRDDALLSLAILKDYDKEKVESFIYDVFLHDPEPEARISTMLRLVGWGRRDIIPTLKDRLLKGGDEREWFQIVRSLYALGGPEAYVALHEARQMEETKETKNRYHLELLNEAIFLLNRENRTENTVQNKAA